MSTIDRIGALTNKRRLISDAKKRREAAEQDKRREKLVDTILAARRKMGPITVIE